MPTDRRHVFVRPEYRQPTVVRDRMNTPSPPTPSVTTTPVAHPLTEGVCVGGGFEGRTHAYAKAVALLDSPTTTKEQLQEVIDQLLLLQMDGDKPDERALAMWTEAVYQAYCDALGGRGAAGVGPMVFRKLLGGGTSWRPVAQFVAAAKLHDMQVVEQQSIYMMLARMLVRHVRSVARYHDTPLSPKMVASSTHLLGGLWENEFPGYLEAGLVRMIARQLCRPRKQA